jgi:hypothetical protein
MKSVHEVEQMLFGLHGSEFPGGREAMAQFMKIGDAGFTREFLEKSLESPQGRQLFNAFTLAFLDRQSIPEEDSEIIDELLLRALPENALETQSLISINEMQ